MTLIKKRIVKMEDDYDTHPDWGKIALFLLCIALMVIVIASFSSCNPTKRAYNGIAAHEPKTTADTTHLINRARTVIKTPVAVVKPGKVIIKKNPC